MVRLLVIGDTVLDRDVHGAVNRISPDAPIPVLDVEQVHDRPGGAGLAALLAARPGVQVTLATGVGYDAAGRRVRQLLRGQVGVSLIRPALNTPGRVRMRSRGQSLLRVDDSGHLMGDDGVLPESSKSFAHTVPETAVDRSALEQCIQSADAIVVADYGGPVTKDPVVREMLQRSVSHLPVVWDPHPRGLPPVLHVAVATPNKAEAERTLRAGGDVPAMATQLRQMWHAQAVVVTDGSQGAVLATDESDSTGQSGATADQAENKNRRYQATPCAPSVDTCGAGDWFVGSERLAPGR
ncbi:MAG: PfkB family carbohydrate kinase [Actinomycetota bacterium]